MRILSIDPGYERLGIAILEKEKLLYSSCFKTPKEKPFNERLCLIGREIKKIIDEWKPNTLAMETLLFNSNQKTATKVSEVRGAILFLASNKELSFFEYSPPQVKVAVTGYGRATKEQVGDMVKRILKLDDKIKSDDELDAIAVGLTCLAIEKR